MKDISIEQLKKTISKGSNFKIKTSDEFDRSIAHIIRLLKDAYILYDEKSYGTVVFLAISAIEEIGKVHLGLYINAPKKNMKRGKDPLRNHKIKEIIGANYTIKMGQRLQDEVGITQIEEIMSIAYEGKMKDLRESSIYCDREAKSDQLVFPIDQITKKFSKNILLFALESFDDNLVGYTSYSMEASFETDMMFRKLCEN